MLTPLRTVAVAAAALVIALAGYSVLGNRPSVGAPSTPVATAAPSPTLAPSPTVAPSPRISGAIVVGNGAHLAAGTTYVMPNFDPPFTFKGVDGVIFDVDAATYAWLEHATSQRPLLGVVAVGSVFDETGAAISAPSDLVAWIQSRGDLSITKSSPIQLGSVSGTLIEGTLKATAHANSAGYVNVFCPKKSGCDFESGGSSGFDPGQQLEIVVATVNGKQIVASGGATPAEWPTIGADFDAFLRSMSFPG
jgi:hypothetical protein